MDTQSIRRINYRTYMDKGYVIVIKTAYADSIYTKHPEEARSQRQSALLTARVWGGVNGECLLTDRVSSGGKDDALN